MTRLRTAARIGAVATVGSAGVLGAGAAGLAAYFTRRVVTPDHVKPDDVWIVDVDSVEGAPSTVTVQATPETSAPGRYGLWFDGRVGHARLGEVLHADDEVVVRPVLHVDSGVLRSGPGRWNGYYYAGTPTSALGLVHEDVEIPTQLGPMTAWAVRGEPSAPWALLVHGRGATREECLRAVTPMRDAGLNVLVVSYRNDQESPSDPSGLYALGDSEWRDVEAAMLWAVQQGARDLVLVGWSMGGAIVLQSATRSWLADRVRAVVLDGPVVDWHAVLDHQSGVNHLPRQITRMGHGMLRHPLGRRVIGLREPLDLRRLDWVTRAAELRLPVLLIHSDGDEYVPNGASRSLAAARPDLVTLEPWHEGRHTKEWNTDPQRWDAVVADFVTRRLRP